jgi:hypothetical protein
VQADSAVKSPWRFIIAMSGAVALHSLPRRGHHGIAALPTRSSTPGSRLAAPRGSAIAGPKRMTAASNSRPGSLYQEAYGEEDQNALGTRVRS